MILTRIHAWISMIITSKAFICCWLCLISVNASQIAWRQPMIQVWGIWLVAFKTILSNTFLFKSCYFNPHFSNFTLDCVFFPPLKKKGYYPRQNRSLETTKAQKALTEKLCHTNISSHYGVIVTSATCRSGHWHSSIEKIRGCYSWPVTSATTHISF